MKCIFKAFFLLLIVTFSLNAAKINLLYDAESDGSIHPSSVWIVDMIKEAGKNRGIEVSFEGAPWSRALELVALGHADGLINASYKESRAKFAVYPFNNGKLDERKSLKAPAYHLYKRKDSNLDFDGKKLINANGLIGAVKSYAVVDNLKDLYASIGFGVNVTSNLNSVLHGKFIATAELAHEADIIIEENPSMKKNLEKLPIPVRKKEYYLIISKHFYQDHKNIAETLWDEIAHLKNTQKYIELRK